MEIRNIFCINENEAKQIQNWLNITILQGLTELQEKCIFRFQD